MLIGDTDKLKYIKYNCCWSYFLDVLCTEICFSVAIWTVSCCADAVISLSHSLFVAQNINRKCGDICAKIDCTWLANANIRKHSCTQLYSNCEL